MGFNKTRIAGLVWGVLMLVLNFGVERHQFAFLLSIYTLAFAAYVFIIKNFKAQDFTFFIIRLDGALRMKDPTKPNGNSWVYQDQKIKDKEYKELLQKYKELEKAHRGC